VAAADTSLTRSERLTALVCPLDRSAAVAVASGRMADASPCRFHPVRSRKIFEEAVEQVVDAIRLGSLHAGDRLPSERELARQLEISRPSLREATKLLAEAGIVEIRRGGGSYVVSEAVPTELLRRRSRLRVEQVGAVLESRRLFEPRVAQLAALRATESDYAALQQSIDRQRAAIGDRDRFLAHDVQFHLAIAHASRNPTVVEMMELLMTELEMARDMTLRGPLIPEWVVGVHERTLAAIMQRDFARIEVVMDEHLAQLETVWAEESGRGMLRELPEFLRRTA
jgi:GntR family transcriptional repressor for pyruvate dehydrogenase complex